MMESSENENKQICFFPHIGQQLFTDNKREIERANANLLGMAALLGILMFLALFLILSVTSDVPHIPFFAGRTCVVTYLIPSAICSCILFYCRFYAEKQPALILPFFYSLFILVYIYAAVNHFISSPSGQVFTFEMVVLMMPFVILDRTWRLTLFQLVFLAAFIYCDIHYKGSLPGVSRHDDIINMVICFILGQSGGHTIRYSRIQALENRRIVIVQRDTDELTRLPNRRKLFHELRKSFDGRALPVKCLLMADIDFFKRYNDSFGHPAGDEVLHKIGDCFRTFGEKTGFELFRYGGEEFIGLYRLPGGTDFQEAAHSLCEAVRGLKIERALHDMPFITISMGYAVAEKTHPEGFEEFIAKADSALYEAKRRGRNCCIEYISPGKQKN
ncbi:MAG: GGDEF domain-containing protein [Treponema sp.]|nr:GGDEF domain-containing protein [Treponema sp.]